MDNIRFYALCETAEPEDVCDEITSGILDSVKETLPLQNSIKPQWMSPKTKEAINTKHKTRKEKGHQSIEYKIAKAESKKLVKKDRLNQIEKEIDNISTLPPHKQYYAALKKLKSKPKNISWGIQDKDGEVLTDKQT